MSSDRIDKVLLERGLALTRSQAQHHLSSGHVYLNNIKVLKASTQVSEKDVLEIRAEQFVGRGAMKLEAALLEFKLDVKNQKLMDVGASTGGFTEILLKNGATQILAVDVGSNQLAEKLLKDPRVINLEKTHILELKKESLPFLPQGFVIDLSFISIKKVLSHLFTLGDSNPWIIALVKPQFEIGSELLPKDGVLKDEKLRIKVLKDMESFVVMNGWKLLGSMESPILGKSGNKEYFICFRKGSETQ